ncbi:MAG: O-antigen ligase family protein [Solirubrobacterales bacterium]
METTTAAPNEGPRRLDWGAVWTWVLGFALVVYLGLNGGGYDPLVSDQAGIAAWWVLLAAVAVGALPRRRLGALAWVAIGLLAAFLAWTVLSLIWTESAERTSIEIARVGTYLGVFGLAAFSRGRDGARVMLGAVGSAIVLIALVALLSRLHPAWFPEGRQTARFLTAGRERLSYPLNYWNALAALIAIGLPLVVQAAADARSAVLRGLAGAAIPLLILTAFFTLSRAGIAAAALAVLVYLIFAPDRLPKLLVLGVGGLGGGVLVLAALQRDELRHGLLNEAARHQGDQMLPIAIGVCLLAGLLIGAIGVALDRRQRPTEPAVSPETARIGAVAAVLVLVVVALLAGAPGRIANGWDEFKEPTGGAGKGADRLSSASGESRYQFWSAAVKEAGSAPMTGTGAGTFEFWWDRHADVEGTIRDTHSLYLQTLGELGIVGIAILAGFLLTVLIGGGRMTLRGPPELRAPLAAALAGCVAFCLTATFDWMWQVPVVPVAMLLLASTLVGTRAAPAPEGAGAFAWPARAAVGAAALIAIVAIAIPLASATLVRQSQSNAAHDDLQAALDAAQTAQDVQPSAATPRLQLALLYEQSGALGRAAHAAQGAVDREETNWRTWLVLARVEAERGNAEAAIAAYRKARSLNRFSPLFERS